MIPHGVFPSHFIFLWLHSGVWKFLGQALKLSCSCDLCRSNDNARSLNPLLGQRLKLASLQQPEPLQSDPQPPEPQREL